MVSCSLSQDAVPQSSPAAWLGANTAAATFDEDDNGLVLARAAPADGLAFTADVDVGFEPLAAAVPCPLLPALAPSCTACRLEVQSVRSVPNPLVLNP